MIDYVRPPVVIEEFLDDDGTVIPCGSRWADNDGPEDTYSVAKHPERFQPLMTWLTPSSSTAWRPTPYIARIQMSGPSDSDQSSGVLRP